MGRWRECRRCDGRGFIDLTYWSTRCPRCQGVGQVAPPNPQSDREARLAADHPHDPPHTGCPACVADDPMLGIN